MAQAFPPLSAGRWPGQLGLADDPKSFAAMRCTEARLTRLRGAAVELGQGTVEWLPNSTGPGKKLAMLPARPAQRKNCSTAPLALRAVWPPTYRRTTCAKWRAPHIRLMDDPDATRLTCANDMCRGRFSDRSRGDRHAACGTDPQDLRETGNGSVPCAPLARGRGDMLTPHCRTRCRAPACWSRSPRRCDPRSCRSRDLRRGRSREKPTRLVISRVPTGSISTRVMLHLFATTDLERSYRVNLNMIGLDGARRSRICVDPARRVAGIGPPLCAGACSSARQRSRAPAPAGRLLVAFLNLDEGDPHHPQRG